jgi:hypothetical protein
MIIAIILILFAVALFLIFHDDHDDSYTRSDKRQSRESGQKSVYQKSAEPKRTPAAAKPAPAMDPRTIVPKEKEYRPKKLDERFKPAAAEPKYAPAPNAQPEKQAHTSRFIYEEEEDVLDFHFLDRIEYDPNLPERTMSSFIAGLKGHCTERDLGGIVGYVFLDKTTGAMEVHNSDGRMLGLLPMKDRTAFLAFNPTLVTCPFAGHLAVSVTGAFYADIRIVLPSTRDFVEESLTGFLG